METIDPQLETGWKEALWDAFQSDSFRNLKSFLVEEKQTHTVYPPGPLIFNALNTTPLNHVKVVIIGQDPYHGRGQAHGLCFSVQHGINPPPSLVNIFKELQQDVGCKIPSHGNLEPWARQGVLLLNATLTVRANQAGSHQGKGWEPFTDQVIQVVSEQLEGIVFLLWGRFAQAKEGLINTSRHHVLKAAHPSPFSASNGFFGCRHFSKTNELLTGQNKTPINWQL